MGGWSWSAVLPTVLLAGIAGLAAAEAPRMTVAARPPDGAAVLRGILGEALADGSNGALILFVARYPGEPAADAARAALAGRHAPDPGPASGPDGDIVAAFDRARLAGAAALDAFALRYPNHPLGAEARLWGQRLRDDPDGRNP